VRPNYLGEHFIIELFDCDQMVLNSIPKLEAMMLEAARLAKATVVSKAFHQFSPYGISGTIVIQESHFNIHTWPEYGFAAIDLFTCGTRLNAESAKDFLIEKCNAQSFDLSKIKRGILNKNV